jgi:hypothetical protein
VSGGAVVVAERVVVVEGASVEVLVLGVGALSALRADGLATLEPHAAVKPPTRTTSAITPSRVTVRIMPLIGAPCSSYRRVDATPAQSVPSRRRMLRAKL